MDLFNRAAHFALTAHEGMTRKRENIPFILHPMEVATIVSTMTHEPEVIAAALLHDVVEDTPTTLDEIKESFGPRVAALVAAETEDKRSHLPSGETWRVRKEESLAELAATSDEGVVMLWLADKLSNMRSFSRQHCIEGSALWNHFNQKDPAKQEWYYRRVAALTSGLSHTAAWQEYTTLLNVVFESED